MELTEQVREMLAYHQIYSVLVKFSRGVDRLDAELVRSCYHPDAIDRHGLYNGSVDNYIENMLRRQSNVVSAAHYVHNFHADVRGEIALTETYATAVERSLDEQDELVDTSVGVRYLDRFERRAGGPWLIAERSVVLDWVNTTPVDEGPLGAVPFTRGARDNTDPSYATAANTFALEQK